MNNTRKLQMIDEILTRLPRINCQRKCQEACGPILMSRLEWKRICHRVGHVPGPKPDLTCPLLKDGLCSVYDIRPAICRLWGLVKKMACPWGCEPERWLTDEEAGVVLDKVRRIGDSL